MAKAIEIELDDLLGDAGDRIRDAILAQLPAEKKDALIEAALTHLTKENPNTYQKESLLEQAFYRAVDAVAREVAVDAVAARRDDIIAIANRGLDKALADERTIETLGQKFSDTLSGIFSGRNY